MFAKPVKAQPTIACCGIDCGLCPRFYTEGASRCPGCGAPGFFEKHPSCAILACCVTKHNLEVCGECREFPCQKLDKWDSRDSFVTHARSVNNLRAIKKQGLKTFLVQQKQRILLLQNLLKDYNDGRSRNIYCLATTLLTIPGLKRARQEGKKKIEREKIIGTDTKSSAQIMRAEMETVARKEKVNLRLRG